MITCWNQIFIFWLLLRWWSFIFVMPIFYAGLCGQEGIVGNWQYDDNFLSPTRFTAIFIFNIVKYVRWSRVYWYYESNIVTFSFFLRMPFWVSLLMSVQKMGYFSIIRIFLTICDLDGAGCTKHGYKFTLCLLTVNTVLGIVEKTLPFLSRELIWPIGFRYVHGTIPSRPQYLKWTSAWLDCLLLSIYCVIEIGHYRVLRLRAVKWKGPQVLNEQENSFGVLGLQDKFHSRLRDPPFKGKGCE